MNGAKQTKKAKDFKLIPRSDWPLAACDNKSCPCTNDDGLRPMYSDGVHTYCDVCMETLYGLETD